MLMFRDVDTLDSLRTINESFATIYIILPFTHTQRLFSANGESEAIALAMLPVSLVVGTIAVEVLTMSMRQELAVCLTCIEASRISSQREVDAVALGGAHHS